MDSNTIREKFVAFFGEREHTRVPSSSFAPNDPSLLRTNAGTSRFKPYFLGEQAPWNRALGIRKCFPIDLTVEIAGEPGIDVDIEASRF